MVGGMLHCVVERCSIGGDTREAWCASIQLYDDTSGLTVGDPLAKTDLPLCLELGLGILDNLYDGIQCALERSLEVTQSVVVPRGLNVPNISGDIAWESTPCKLKAGDIVTDEDISGSIRENGLLKTHYITVLPKVVRGEGRDVGPT